MIIHEHLHKFNNIEPSGGRMLGMFRSPSLRRLLAMRRRLCVQLLCASYAKMRVVQNPDYSESEQRS